MRRRDFIAGLGGAAATWPVVARAQQQPTMPKIGFLGSTDPELHAEQLRSFWKGLEERGFTEGRNVSVVYRWAHGQTDQLSELAAELVRERPNVIVTTNSTPLALAAKAATQAIPIVFMIGADPVEAGLVTSLSRPGGNITGTTGLGLQLQLKRLQLLHELIPNAATVAFLLNPSSFLTKAAERGLLETSKALGVQSHAVYASSDNELAAAFAKALELKAGALLIGIDPFFTSKSERIATLALQNRLPTIYVYRRFVAAGGLMSYGSNSTETTSQAGAYVGRILRGEKPADLPVVQSTKVELFINLKTAKTLGLAVPLSLLGRADEVIE